jgi:hypothetical protein
MAAIVPSGGATRDAGVRIVLKAASVRKASVSPARLGEIVRKGSVRKEIVPPATSAIRSVGPKGRARPVRTEARSVGVTTRARTGLRAARVARTTVADLARRIIDPMRGATTARSGARSSRIPTRRSPS